MIMSVHRLIIPAFATIVLVVTTGLAQSSTKPADALLTKLKPPDRRVRDVAYSPDGKLVAAGKKLVQIWNVKEGELLNELSDPPYETNILIGQPHLLLSKGK